MSRPGRSRRSRGRCPTPSGRDSAAPSTRGGSCRRDQAQGPAQPGEPGSPGGDPARRAHRCRVLSGQHRRPGGPRRARPAVFSSSDPDDAYRGRLVAGRGFSGDGAREAVVHELLLYQLGLVGDDDVGQALGRPIRVEYRADRVGQFTLARLLTFGPEGFTPKEGEAVARRSGGSPRWPGSCRSRPRSVRP